MAQVQEKKQIVEAIGALGRRVTAADVALKTGLPVLKVSQLLNTVASETGGHLQVGQGGDLAYVFNPGFSGVYLTKGIARFFEQFWESFVKVAVYLLKISFGIMLIVSLAIIVITIVILMNSQRRDRDGDGGFDFHFGFFDYMLLREIFYWNAYSSARTNYDYDRPTLRRRQKSNFLLDCFSFLFGDGDPNEGLAEKRWQVIAEVIKDKNYVVTAEQLAPYLGTEPKDESAVLPVLVRFNGKPEVTEKGNIVYTFSDFATTALNSPSISRRRPPEYLQEFPHKFTNLDQGQLMPVYLISGANFLGSWALYSMVHRSSEESGVVSSPIFGALVTYGTLFLAVPLIRFFILQFLNRRIEARNKKSLAFANQLKNPGPELSAKLAEARDFMTRAKVVSQENLAYTTEENALGQPDELDAKFKLEVGDKFDANPSP